MSATTQHSQTRSEFTAALNQIAAERNIDPSVVLSSIEEAIVAAYKKDAVGVLEDDVFIAQIDPLTGESNVYKVVGKKQIDVTPAGFGRIAAQTAKQVILQKVREAERDAVIQYYSAKIGTIVTGMVLRHDGKNVIMDIGKGQAYMPPEEQMRGEFYRLNTRLTVYIADIRETMRGKTVIVSRAAKELVKELFAREVPEVSSGAVEVKAIAREAGVRAKLAVFSSQQGVDPVGSCVGQKGVRVQEVIKELNNEKIDIIQYTEDPRLFVEQALAPAENLKIEIDEKKKLATVTAPDDQVSLAIGRGGQNARLAAKLTEYKITIKSQSGIQAASVTGSEEFEIDQLDLKEDVRKLLVEKGYTLLYQLRDHLDEIETLGGVGPKAVEAIRAALTLSQPPRPMYQETVVETPAPVIAETQKTE
ncbi:MAG: transcription termination/antitermination protein NusA [Candidatus Pacebacteria bacterium]|nr:transcription termination/antitermination protein NusA [Candidatus Paceibacterota bacterium]